MGKVEYFRFDSRSREMVKTTTKIDANSMLQRSKGEGYDKISAK
jgi:hypothetical protein